MKKIILFFILLFSFFGVARAEEPSSYSFPFTNYGGNNILILASSTGLRAEYIHYLPFGKYNLFIDGYFPGFNLTFSNVSYHISSPYIEFEYTSTGSIRIFDGKKIVTPVDPPTYYNGLLTTSLQMNFVSSNAKVTFVFSKDNKNQTCIDSSNPFNYKISTKYNYDLSNFKFNDYIIKNEGRSYSFRNIQTKDYYQLSFSDFSTFEFKDSAGNSYTTETTVLPFEQSGSLLLNNKAFTKNNIELKVYSGSVNYVNVISDDDFSFNIYGKNPKTGNLDSLGEYKTNSGSIISTLSEYRILFIEFDGYKFGGYSIKDIQYRFMEKNIISKKVCYDDEGNISVDGTNLTDDEILAIDLPTGTGSSSSSGGVINSLEDIVKKTGISRYLGLVNPFLSTAPNLYYTFPMLDINFNPLRINLVGIKAEYKVIKSDIKLTDTQRSQSGINFLIFILVIFYIGFKLVLLSFIFGIFILYQKFIDSYSYLFFGINDKNNGNIFTSLLYITYTFAKFTFFILLFDKFFLFGDVITNASDFGVATFSFIASSVGNYTNFYLINNTFFISIIGLFVLYGTYLLSNKFGRAN